MSLQADANHDLYQFIGIQKKIIPEMVEKLVERYDILRLIYYHQPVGRRTLSSTMGVGERIIRSEVNVLKEQGFIDVKPEGMKTTEFGENTLEVLRDVIHCFKGLNSIEDAVERKLKIKKTIIVPDLQGAKDVVLREVGRVTANYLKTVLKENTVIGITGGETMAMVAEQMSENQKKFENVTVVPGRGGMGRDVEKQANTIAANLAKKLKASYKLLHMPDNISKDILKSLYQEPSVKEVIEHIQKIEFLVFGIGRADKMAKRRGLDEKMIESLIQKGAVAEAFGYYFDRYGKIVQEVNTAGVSLSHYKKLKYVIGAAAGKEKAEAIIAISKLNNNLVLILDEGLAKEILKYEN